MRPLQMSLTHWDRWVWPAHECKCLKIHNTYIILMSLYRVTNLALRCCWWLLQSSTLILIFLQISPFHRSSKSIGIEAFRMSGPLERPTCSNLRATLGGPTEQKRYLFIWGKNREHKEKTQGFPHSYEIMILSVNPFVRLNHALS